jgi:hypothetical protein
MGAMPIMAMGALGAIIPGAIIPGAMGPVSATEHGDASEEPNIWEIKPTL